MPWKILGLDAATATERDVRKAYSKLLRKHRPDTDPEGFQRLHAAYQQAKNYLKSEYYYTSEEDQEIEEPSISISEQISIQSESIQISDTHSTETEEPLSSISETKVPDQLRLAIRKVEQAEVSKDENALAAATQSLIELSIEYPENAADIDSAAAKAIKALGPSYCDSLNEKFLLRLLERETTETFFATIAKLEEAESYRTLNGLAITILEAKARLCHPSAAEVALRIAEIILYTNYYTVERLLNFVFTNLPPSQREYRLSFINRNLGYGRMFRYLELEDKLRWKRIIAGEIKIDPKDRQDKSFLKRSGKTTGSGVLILKQFLDPESWAIFSEKNSKSIYKEPETTSQSGDTNIGCFIAIVAIAVIKLLMSLSR